MNGWTKRRWAPAAALILWAAAGSASGAMMDPSAGSKGGEVRLLPAGRLGIVDWKGSFSIVSEESGPGYFRFWEEPLILRIDPKGPAVGKLLPGDRVVAACGHLITTEKGSRLFSAPEPGAEVELLLRRGGEEIVERIIAARGVPDPEMSSPALPAPPAPAALPAAGAILPAPVLPVFLPPKGDLLPHVWLGMGLRCAIEGSWGKEDLRFVEPPTVFHVRPETAAERAGFRKGDEILAVNGNAIDTREGTACFTAIHPGDRVEWTVERDGEETILVMTAEPSPSLALFAPPSDSVLYIGTIGGASVEVRGSSRISIEEKKDGTGILIRTGEGTIRLWTPEDDGK